MAKSSGTTTTTQQPVGVNRRTILRTGAHAAWAIPAVQIVTQSPALAASGKALLTLSPSHEGRPNQPFTVTFVVTNHNNGSAGATTLEIAGTSANVLTSGAIASAGNDGWVRTVNQSNNYVFQATVPGASSTTNTHVSTFSVTLKSNKNADVVLDLRLVPADGSGVTTTYTVPMK